MRLSTRIFLGFALIILLSSVDSLINYKLTRQVNLNTDFLTNSEAVIRLSSRLHKSIIEMQSGFRGFLLTENESFLSAYYQGQQDIPRLFEEQRLLLSGSPSQIIKLDSIEVLHERWMGFANALIVAKRNASQGKDTEVYKDLFHTQLLKEVGQRLNDQITLQFRQFDRYEYSLRKERRQVLSESIDRTHTISLILALLTVSIGVISSLYIVRIISKRIATMVSFAERVSKGEFRVIVDNQHDELSNLSHSLNIMSNRLQKNFKDLEKKNTELDQFAYVVSHDLKAPLRGMYNIVKWIEEDINELPEQMKKYLSLMKGRIERMESLINGLLEYAKIGRNKKFYSKVDVKMLLDEIVELIIPKEFNVEITKMPVLVAEKIRMEQVFRNLLDNAVKYYNQKEGLIKVDCRELESFYEFSVTDYGPGIAPEYHKKIFTIFQTLRDRETKESTGVGLSIVKKIIEEQKGTIKVKSNKGEGASFVFTWPKSIV
jgi:signal transduction histidine kinase